MSNGRLWGGFLLFFKFIFVLSKLNQLVLLFVPLFVLRQELHLLGVLQLLAHQLQVPQLEVLLQGFLLVPLLLQRQELPLREQLLAQELALVQLQQLLVLVWLLAPQLLYS